MAQLSDVVNKARAVLYSQCLVAIACMGLVYGKAEWRLLNRNDWLLASSAGRGAFCVLLLSCAAFPFAVAYATVGRMSAWRWGVAVALAALLGVLQYAALMLALPVRD